MNNKFRISWTECTDVTTGEKAFRGDAIVGDNKWIGKYAINTVKGFFKAITPNGNNLYSSLEEAIEFCEMDFMVG